MGRSRCLTGKAFPLSSMAVMAEGGKAGCKGMEAAKEAAGVEVAMASGVAVEAEMAAVVVALDQRRTSDISR